MFHNRDPIPKVNHTPSSVTSPRSMPSVLQLAKKVGNKAMTKLLQNQKQPRTPVTQRKLNQANLDKMKADKPDSYEKEIVEKAIGDDGEFTDVQADKGLPTFWGLLKEVYGEPNLNQKWFEKTRADLGYTCDRPHSVTAQITKTTSKRDRKGLGLVTAIGNLGKEEISIREGGLSGLLADYNGGHLVGYQILRGQGADQEWNVAPQDAKNNKESYNNTIEEILRGAKVGTKYEYTVEVKYDQLNFSVDQDQLLKLGILKQIDADKPWEIQLPARIPFKWEAKAEMLNNGQFGSPNEGDSSYDQYSVDMDESKLNFTDSDYTARYHLMYSVNRGADKDYTKKSNELKDTKGVTGIHFSMHQALMSDSAKNKEPIAWKGRERVANYGSVQDGLVADSASIRKVIEKIYEQNRQDFMDYEAIEDVENPEEFDFHPADDMDEMVKEEYQSFFIQELRGCEIKTEYDELKYADQTYLHSFSVRDDDVKSLEQEKDIFKNIETTMSQKDLSPEQLKECKAALQKQSRILSVIIHNKRERMMYSKITKNVRPTYKTKFKNSVKNSIEAYKSIDRIKKKRKKNDREAQILRDFDWNKSSCRRIKTFDGYLINKADLRNIDSE
ncbi:hypothetical protein [Brevibacillus sp. 179-C9.3 HS]|uniref:hypothetical protein n=1 Tax=unclassified Brevibacillus TaxID=2684853 RepID=UPI0039A31446